MGSSVNQSPSGASAITAMTRVVLIDPMSGVPVPGDEIAMSGLRFFCWSPLSPPQGQEVYVAGLSVENTVTSAVATMRPIC